MTMNDWIVAVLAAAGSGLKDRLRDAPAGLMLRQQRIDERQHLSSVPETGKHSLLFRLFVIVLDEIPHDLRSIGDDRRVKVLVRCEFPQAGFVNQQQPVEHAMLAHQILGRGYLGFFFGLLFLLFAGLGGERGRYNQSACECGACNGSHFQDVAFWQDCHFNAPRFRELR